MEKDFAGWQQLKSRLNATDHLPTFQQREIWWCSIGVNVGHELDGKNQLYSRPVLIVRKFNRHIFIGVPLTTKVKDNPYYHRIHLKGQEQCVVLSQVRLWESRRLTRKMGKMDDEEFVRVRNALRSML